MFLIPIGTVTHFPMNNVMSYPNVSRTQRYTNMSNHSTRNYNLKSATNATTPCKNQYQYDNHNSHQVDVEEASHSSLSPDLLKETQEEKAERCLSPM